MSTTTDLLDELRTLRRRPRADARRYAPPLLVFGALILASVLVYQPTTLPADGSYRVSTSLDLLWGNGLLSAAHPELMVAYWIVLLVAGTAFTAWWYHVQAVRRGIELRTQGQLVAAAAAVLGIFVGTPVLWSILGPFYWPEAEPSVHIPLLALSALVAAAALGWSAAPARTLGPRTAGLVVGFVAATIAAGAVTMYLRGYLALVVVAAVVFAIAWVERSWWLALVAAGFATASLFSQITAVSFYADLGWQAELDSRAMALQGVLLPAAVLVVGGLAGLVVRRRVR